MFQQDRHDKVSPDTFVGNAIGVKQCRQYHAPILQFSSKSYCTLPAFSLSELVKAQLWRLRFRAYNRDPCERFVFAPTKPLQRRCDSLDAA